MAEGGDDSALLVWLLHGAECGADPCSAMHV